MLFSACNYVPDTAERRYIEQNVKDGDVNFISATDQDSTRNITKDALLRLRNGFARTGNLKSDFPKEAPKVLYFTKIRYTVTHADGKVDSLYQTIYTDKEQTVVYAIKNNN